MVRGGYCSWVLDTTFNLFEKYIYANFWIPNIGSPSGVGFLSWCNIQYVPNQPVLYYLFCFDHKHAYSMTKILKNKHDIKCFCSCNPNWNKTVKHANVRLVSRSFKSMDVIHNEILSFSMRLSVRGPVLPNAHWRSKRSVLWKNNFLTFLEMAYYLIIFYIFIY